MALRPAHLEFIVGTFFHPWEKHFPDSAAQFTHRVYPAIPAVEVADDADPLGIRCPDGKGTSLDAIDVRQVGAELFVDAVMIALREEMNVEFTQDRPEGIRIGPECLLPAEIRDSQAVSRHVFTVWQNRLEKSGVVDLVRFDHLLRRASKNHGDLARGRQKHANCPVPLSSMRPQKCKGIAVTGVQKGIKLGAVERKMTQFSWITVKRDHLVERAGVAAGVLENRTGAATWFSRRAG